MLVILIVVRLYFKVVLLMMYIFLMVENVEHLEKLFIDHLFHVFFGKLSIQMII